MRAWWGVRIGSLVAALIVAGLLIVSPDDGLFVMWKLVIPLLPLVFLVAPGVWRNLCPLAASNQTPRVLGLTRGLTAPAWFKEYGYVVAISLFVLFVVLRKAGLDDNGPASALLLLGALTGGFVGGMYLKGKSGWCSSICPLLPVQRIYGQTPFALVGNSHCQPCVGCTTNCYDFNPKAAYLADLNQDPYWAGYRKFFVAAFPGLVLAFFEVPEAPDAIPVWEMVGQVALYMAVSVASFVLLDSFVKVTTHKLTTLYGALAFNVFYWYGAPAFVEAVTGSPSPDAVDVGAAGGRARADRRVGAARLPQGGAVRRRGRRQGRRPLPRRRPLARALARPEGGRAGGAVRGRLARGREAGRDRARDRRGQRAADRGRLPDGRVRRRPDRDQGRHGEPERDLRRRALDARAPRPRRQHAHGVLLPGRGAGGGRADARQGGRADAEPDPAHVLRPLDRARGRARQRDRGRDRGRPRAPSSPRVPRRPRGRRAAPALQPHGHQPPDLRPLGDGGALPQPRRLVRRAPDRDVAEHARRRDRPRHERGRARHRRAPRLRPADPRAGLERDGAADRRLRRPRHVRGPQRRGRALDPRVRAARVVPRGADRGRRAARARGRLRAAQARPARLDPRALRPAAAAPARRARVAVPAALPRGPGHEHRHARGDRRGARRRAAERGAAARRPRAARRPAARVRGHHAEHRRWHARRGSRSAAASRSTT